MSIVLMADVLYLQLLNEFFPHKANNDTKYTKQSFFNPFLAKFSPFQNLELTCSKKIKVEEVPEISLLIKGKYS